MLTIEMSCLCKKAVCRGPCDRQSEFWCERDEKKNGRYRCFVQGYVVLLEGVKVGVWEVLLFVVGLQELV